MRFNTFVAALIIAALAACGSDTAGASDSTATTDSATDGSGANRPGANRSAATPGITDADIVGFFDAVNLADSTFGMLASTKGTHADVRALGVMVKNDHHSLRAQVQHIATRLGITPTPPAIDSLPEKTRRITDSLETIPKGDAFDRAYLENVIANHETVLHYIDQAIGAAQDAKLEELLTIARPIIDMHLGRAREIRSKLGAGGAP